MFVANRWRKLGEAREGAIPGPSETVCILALALLVAGLRTLVPISTSSFMFYGLGDVMTNGFGAMPSYASRVESDDRWRIVAYIRALQLSESAPQSDVPPDQIQTLTVEPPPRTAGNSGTPAGPQGANQ